MTGVAPPELPDNRIGPLVRDVAAYFDAAALAYGHGTDNAFDEAGWLVFAVANLDHADAAKLNDRLLTDDRVAEIRQLAQRRASDRQPLAYLLGEAWFAGLKFRSDARALVPRSPIAELIVNGLAPWLALDASVSALDIGTGGGCIAIALAAHHDMSVVAIDVDAAALALARDNAREHGCDERVEFMLSDVYASVPARRFDLIISNPPYVDAASMTDLPTEYRHEPAHGLGAGFSGLDVVDKILAGARDFLSDRGIVVVEVGDTQAALDAAYPDLAVTWLTMSDGASGIFLVTRYELDRWAAARGD